jgi:serine/threonine-protein kinase RsbW
VAWAFGGGVGAARVTPPAFGERWKQPAEGGCVEPFSITGEVIRLTVPASLEYVRLVRLTASGVASTLGFDVDELENLRVAVDELTSLILEIADGNNLDVEFVVRDDVLTIEGRVGAPLGASVVADPLSAQILGAVIDDYDLRVEDGEARFTCTRRLPAA